MTYNPEDIIVKRPRKGEIWTDARLIALHNVIIHGRYTLSALQALGRREKLSECEDLYSVVMYGPLDWLSISFAYESEFVERFKFVKKAQEYKPAKEKA